MGTVSLRDVCKAFGALQVVHDVCVDIDDGEFVVLVGPSGCGKSTLLRMIAGLEEISAGTISVAGRVVNDLRPKERDIAMVFQSYALYPHMTVAENMGFSLKLARADKAERQRRVAEAARILGLEALLERKPAQLSGGQRQRVAMGRSIVRDPAVFLFDEPLSNLDAKLRVQMRSEIKALHQRLRTTTVYVTHDQIEAMTLADRIVVMNGGRVEQIGSPLDLYDRPANVFVATFIGSPAMNLLPARIVEGRAHLSDGAAVDLGGRAPPNGARILLGIRPEHLLPDPLGLPSEIITVEPTGAETLVTARLAGQEIVGTFRERIALRPGEALPFRPDPGALHLFDADTGQRLGPHS